MTNAAVVAVYPDVDVVAVTQVAVVVFSVVVIPVIDSVDFVVVINVAVPAVVGLMKKAFSYGDRDRSSIDESNQDALKSMPPAAAGLGLGMTALAGTLGDVVVPTAGIGLNPFMREARQIRKETKKDVKKIAEAKSRDMEGKSGRMDAITKRETADVDRLIRLYEKKHGVKVKRKETEPTTYQSFMGGGIMKVKKK